MPSGDNRSINIGGNASGNVFTTGNNNIVRAATKVTLPPPESVDPQAELTALRAALTQLQLPDPKRVNNALDEVASETAKQQPNKLQISDDLARALKAAKTASDFTSQVQTLIPPVTAVASWLGHEGQQLLSLLRPDPVANAACACRCRLC